MSTFATHQESDRRLAELTELTRDAWERYQAELCDLQRPVVRHRRAGCVGDAAAHA